MKTFAFMVLLGVSLSAAAQDRDRDRDDRRDRDRGQRYEDNRDYHAQANIPGRVNNRFRSDHPYADNAQWERRGRNWHATYEDRDRDNRRVDAYYDRRGRMIDQHVMWDRNRMPRDFDDRVYDRYHSHDYTIYRIERPGLSPIFQLLFGLPDRQQVVYVDEYGNPVDYRDWH